MNAVDLSLAGNRASDICIGKRHAHLRFLLKLQKPQSSRITDGKQQV